LKSYQKMNKWVKTFDYEEKYMHILIHWIHTNFATNDFWMRVHKPPTSRKFRNHERIWTNMKTWHLRSRRRSKWDLKFNGVMPSCRSDALKALRWRLGAGIVPNDSKESEWPVMTLECQNGPDPSDPEALEWP
jgi:hypothetical protein